MFLPYASLLAWLVPIFVLMVAIEAIYIVRVQRRPYPWRESAGSLGIAIGSKLLRLVSGAAGIGASLGAAGWLWEHRLFTIPTNTVGGIAALFLASEFAYYWHHRIGHTSRWFWASHAPHHSPEHFMLSNAYRLGWTGAFTGAGLFYAPLVVLGFHPVAVGTALAINLFYQFWLHTELIPRLGWVELVFNTPSHHRVHHASNEQFLDKNYGGILIVYDRLFGTLAVADADTQIRYGLLHGDGSSNPLKIAFAEWLAIGRDLRRSRSWREVAGYLFAAPGWQPNKHRSK